MNYWKCSIPLTTTPMCRWPSSWLIWMGTIYPIFLSSELLLRRSVLVFKKHDYSSIDLVVIKNRTTVHAILILDTIVIMLHLQILGTICTVSSGLPVRFLFICSPAYNYPYFRLNIVSVVYWGCLHRRPWFEYSSGSTIFVVSLTVTYKSFMLLDLTFSFVVMLRLDKKVPWFTLVVQLHLS